MTNESKDVRSAKPLKDVPAQDIFVVLNNLYKKGLIVKALDESGKPHLRDGQQVYKHIDYATAAERTFRNKEIKVN
jgi:hypothetical protein